MAGAALACYGFGGSVGPELVHVSENATFAVHDSGGTRWALRIYRPGYQTSETIESELAWMDALRRQAGLRTPKIRSATDGRRVVDVTDGRPGSRRRCVLFEWLAGTHPRDDDASSFEGLGAVTAQMHLHSRRWTRPAGFARFSWDLEAAFGPAPRWGHWRDGMGVGPSEAEVLGRLEAVIRQRLLAYGQPPARFGLVHADTRLDNLLVREGRVSVIDFDDCGFSWFLYDLATAFSFFEDAPQVPELIERWLTGYRGVAALSTEDEGEIWTFILLRRLLLVAWLGSHSTLELAEKLGARYTAGACELAERYLALHS